MSAIALTEANRFTNFVKSKRSEDYQDIENWRKWFLKRGIPCTIYLTTSGYAVYREGLIEVDIHEESNN